MRWLLLALVLFLAPPARACDGDCDGDGKVFIEELIRAVQIALDREPVANCRAADRDGNGVVAVDELVGAVDAALDGCASVSPTPPLSPTPTATPDPGLANCGDGTLNGSEECDDGNTASGDGCSALCALEPGGNVCAGVAASPGATPSTVLITDQLQKPISFAAPRLDPHRLFVIEQPGRIRIIKDDTLLSEPFLAIEDRVSCCVERGLLGLAFHPDYENNGRFFVNYTAPDGSTVIARYKVSADNPDRADRDSEQIMLTIGQPFPNHNGGQTIFGPDGYLYIGMGDGGSGGDPFGNAQNDDSLLGKLLRMDVDVEDEPFYAVPASNPHPDRGAPLGLIWAKGLRNPWRFSFDRATGEMYIADVGQANIEEVDVQAASSTGGENYGWNVFEGSACFHPPNCPDPPTGFTFPVYEYTHTEHRCSLTGGFAYRGCALPDLHGLYFLADYCTRFIETFRLVDGRATDIQNRTQALAPGGGATIDSVTSFGEDARGELYIADYDGQVYKIVPGS